MAPSRLLFSNFASGVLSADIDEFDTQIPLRPGEASRFPTPQVGYSTFRIVIEGSGITEVCDCTSVSGDTLIVTRGVEGTSAEGFIAGSRVECRVTAGVLNAFMQATDPHATQLLVADLGVATLFVEPANQSAGNRMNFPAGGGVPYIGADGPHGRIVTYSDLPLGVILMWSGNTANIPAQWKLCDGQNGTPDLRTKFVVGATAAPGPYTPGSQKLARGTVTGAIPNHSHGGATVGAQLTVAQLPGIFLQLQGGRLDGQSLGYRSDGATNNLGPQTISFGGSQGHLHGINPDGGTTTGWPIPNVDPAYYALCYIMKVA